MNRRRFLGGAAATTLAPRVLVTPLADGQTVVFKGVERVLTDVIAPSAGEAGHAMAVAALAAILAAGGIMPASEDPGRDRWGRATGAIPWRRADGADTTLQELLLEAGGARVYPQSDDFGLIERCYASELRARTRRVGLWALKRFAPIDANEGRLFRGFQIYEGAIAGATERKGRIYFNFGGDFRIDFTATVRAAAFRRWRERPDLSALAGRRAEVRGHVERINGPSIELLHEKQMRLL